MPSERTHAAWAIETQGLTKRYGDVDALNGVDLRIATNTIYALLGPNGAGKTTTLSILTTLLPPTSGSATVAGLDVVKQAKAVRRRIGVTFQETVLDIDLTGRQALDFHGRLYGQPRQVRRALSDEMLALVQLEEAADRRIKTYSGGMKRRLELARGLMTQPDVLFLDEPTLGLDPQNRAGIWDYIRDLKERHGLTLLLTTHYMDEAEQLADRVGIIDHGRIVAEGTPHELIDQMGSDVILVSGHGARDGFLAALTDRPFVESTQTGNGIIHIGVDSGNRRLVEVVETAHAAGFRIEDVRVVKPSLGDVFLKFTGREFRDDA